MHHFGLKISVGVIVFCFFFSSLCNPSHQCQVWRYKKLVSTLTGLAISTCGSQECLGKHSLLNCLSHESLANYLCRLYLAREVPIILLSNRKEILIRLSCHYPFSSANSHSCITEYINQQISESQPKRRCETLQQLELSLHMKSSLWTVSRTDLAKMGKKTPQNKESELQHPWLGRIRGKLPKFYKLKSNSS